MIYFLAKKKLALKNNFEETIEYLPNLGVDDIFQWCSYQFHIHLHLQCWTILEGSWRLFKRSNHNRFNCCQWFHHTSWWNYWRSRLFVDVDFCSFLDAFDNKPVERFLGIVKLTTSKKTVDLHEIIMKHHESENIGSLCIYFSGLDGTVAMSGEQKGL